MFKNKKEDVGKHRMTLYRVCLGLGGENMEVTLVDRPVHLRGEDAQLSIQFLDTYCYSYENECYRKTGGKIKFDEFDVLFYEMFETDVLDED